MHIPAEIWRYNHEEVSKLIMTPEKIRSILFDPREQTADADMSNNSFPRRPVRTRFQLFKEERRPNPMQLLERKLPAD